MKDTPNLDLMNKFTEKNLPNLDKVVLGALELFTSKGLPKKPTVPFKKPIIVGSGNAIATGKALYPNSVSADESTYQKVLENNKDIDGVVLISASGGKHAPIIAQEIKKRRIKTLLLTCNKNGSAIPLVDNYTISLKNREPYTYNTSTYMGMMLGVTGESPKEIYDFILKQVNKKIPKNLKKYDAFYLIVPDKFDSLREMFLTKFDELFGPKVSGRVYTMGQTMHAKTVVPSNKECFISFGVENNAYGIKGNRIFIPMPEKAQEATMLAIGYYTIGRMQEQHPPYFKKNIVKYCKEASKVFGTELKAVVE